MLSLRKISLSLAALLLSANSTFASAAPSFCADVFSGRIIVAQGQGKITGGLAIRPRAIIVSAPSGAGKSTLIKLLTTEFPQSFERSISTTTRAPRGQEKDGLDYHFLSVPEFEARLKRGEFIESAKVHDNYYGTSRAEVSRILSSGKSVILDIDVQGAANVRSALAGSVFSLFIRPPDMTTLEQRLRARGTETEEAITRRLKNASTELAKQNEYDAVVVNDDLDQSFADLKTVLESIAP